MQFWQVSGKGEMVKFVAGMWEAVPIWAVDIHTRRAGPPSDPHSSTASLCLGFSVCQGGKVTLTLFWKVMWQAQSIRQLWEALRDLLELQIQKQGKILSAGCKDLKKKTFWHAIAAEVPSLERSGEGISQCPLFIWTPPHASILIQHSRDSSYCVKIKCTYR